VPTLPIWISSREDWGARPPKRVLPNTERPTRIIVHRSDTQIVEDPRSLQEFQMGGQGLDDIGYHFLITRGGTIYEGRELEFRGAHCRGQDDDSIGLCFFGNGEEVTAHAAQAGRLLVAWICSKFPIEEIVPHLRFENTDCPGPALKRWTEKLPPPENEGMRRG
jgi:hypothetical protein